MITDTVEQKPATPAKAGWEQRKTRKVLFWPVTKNWVFAALHQMSVAKGKPMGDLAVEICEKWLKEQGITEKMYRPMQNASKPDGEGK